VAINDQPSPEVSFHRWEDPDVTFLAIIGDLSRPEMRRILDETNASAKGKPYIFGLIDMSRVGTISPEARVVARTEAGHFLLRGTAVFGASFHHRVIALLANKAAALLKKDHQPIAFFATEAEARAWIDERRREVLAKERR
jgi:hypothetical protein